MFGEDSKEILNIVGADAPEESVFNRGWRCVDHMKSLGAWLSGSGSSEKDWRETKKAMWSAFHGNLGKDGFRWSQMGKKKCARICIEDTFLKIGNVSRAVLPILRYRWVFWSLSETRCKAINALQTLRN